ncbi:helix-turn-helix domain-containing protein [Celeribacter litoreus]|uniref:helix-turn-helix domain-containing protein n=1 Tax=Celeribacter litoreus TaxID=2876714 RepID=UPI0037C0CCE3
MTLSEWLRSAQGRGWSAGQVTPEAISLHCSSPTCSTHISRSLRSLGRPPKPCRKKHPTVLEDGRHDPYAKLVAKLRRRRVELGLGQEDVNAAVGFADGYISKLEAMHRFPHASTLVLWCQTLGIELIEAPAPLPQATISAIEGRRSRPYARHQARFKANSECKEDGVERPA